MWGLERGYGFITRHRAPRLYFASGETLTQSIFKDLAVQGDHNLSLGSSRSAAAAATAAAASPTSATARSKNQGHRPAVVRKVASLWNGMDRAQICRLPPHATLTACEFMCMLRTGILGPSTCSTFSPF